MPLLEFWLAHLPHPLPRTKTWSAELCPPACLLVRLAWSILWAAPRGHEPAGARVGVEGSRLGFPQSGGARSPRRKKAGQTREANLKKSWRGWEMGVFPLRALVWLSQEGGVSHPWGVRQGLCAAEVTQAKCGQSGTPGPSFCELCLKLTGSGDGQVAFDPVTNVTPPGRPRPGDPPVSLHIRRSGIPSHNPL